ncbi:hypothetical protein ZWY2020_014212 [Hordeum vulgare]|nr:hypothetical protein ZWY2020_014212 [Hordeum vulgare]
MLVCARTAAAFNDHVATSDSRETCITFYYIVPGLSNSIPSDPELLEREVTDRITLAQVPGLPGDEDGSSLGPPVRQLKLTSRTMILWDDNNSSGKPPDSELRDRLRCNRPVRLPRNGDPFPSAAVGVPPPQRRESTVLREPNEELKKGGLLLLRAGAGRRHQGDQQHEGQAKGRHVKFLHVWEIEWLHVVVMKQSMEIRCLNGALTE